MKTCILAFARNEEDQIDEWIKYHLNLGFTHIFILDNNDDDNPLSLKYDNVTVIPYHINCENEYIINKKKHTEVQVDAYNSMFKKLYDDGYEYCAVIDIDEFIKFNNHYTNIGEFIKEQMIDKSRTMCELYWEVYSDNGIIWEKDCKDSIIETYTQKTSDLIDFKTKMYDLYTWTKCIIKLFPQTSFAYEIEKTTNGSGNVHWPDGKLLRDKTYTHYIIDKSIAVINHYRTQCLERFVRHKLVNQNFHHVYNNVMKIYFRYNVVTEEKIEAFKKLFDECGMEMPKDMSIYYDNIGHIIGKKDIIEHKKKTIYEKLKNMGKLPQGFSIR